MSGSVRNPSITSSVVIGLQIGASGEDSLPLCLLTSLASSDSSSSMSLSSLSSPSLSSSRILASKYLPTSEDTADYKYIKEILASCSIKE